MPAPALLPGQAYQAPGDEDQQPEQGHRGLRDAPGTNGAAVVGEARVEEVGFEAGQFRAAMRPCRRGCRDG